jgi:hypothetical protein
LIDTGDLTPVEDDISELHANLNERGCAYPILGLQFGRFPKEWFYHAQQRG